jgi:hypothetical protein
MNHDEDDDKKKHNRSAYNTPTMPCPEAHILFGHILFFRSQCTYLTHPAWTIPRTYPTFVCYSYNMLDI